MNIAVTDRTGPDSSELKLNVDRSNETDSAILNREIPPRFPALGTLVCAIGQGGWRYIGPVVDMDVVAGTYTIIPVATNPAADKIKQIGLAPGKSQGYKRSAPSRKDKHVRPTRRP